MEENGLTLLCDVISVFHLPRIIYNEIGAIDSSNNL